MSEWMSQSKKISAVTLFVEDVDATKKFYREVFGLPVFYEDPNSVVFQFGGTLINLLDAGEAHSLIAPAVVASRESGSSFQFTISVINVDVVCEELWSHGVPILNGPMDRAWGIRTASFRDPDGHIWEIAHNLP